MATLREAAEAAATKRKPRVRPWKGWAWVYCGGPDSVYKSGEIAWGALSRTRRDLNGYEYGGLQKRGWKPMRVEIRQVRPKRKK